MPKDERIAYGATCQWWDSIDKVGKFGVLPRCPYCKGVLFEMRNEKEWFDAVDRTVAKGNPEYRKFVEWLRGKCLKDYPTAKAQYLAETGREVTP